LLLKIVLARCQQQADGDIRDAKILVAALIVMLP
jgi:hypothetical protein